MGVWSTQKIKKGEHLEIEHVCSDAEASSLIDLLHKLFWKQNLFARNNQRPHEKLEARNAQNQSSDHAPQHPNSNTGTDFTAINPGSRYETRRAAVPAISTTTHHGDGSSNHTTAHGRGYDPQSLPSDESMRTSSYGDSGATYPAALTERRLRPRKVRSVYDFPGSSDSEPEERQGRTSLVCHGPSTDTRYLI